jgi:MFS family permease
MLHPWRTVAILTLAYTLGYVDRQILNLLVDPIRSDLGIGDTAVSLLQGAAFTIAYIAMNPVFGRLADQRSRRIIMATGITLWSIATFACGLTRDYHVLLLLRMAVGGCEACLIPSAWSLLSDLFDRQTLPRAMSVLLMGPYIGGGIALITGGLVVDLTSPGNAVLPAGLQPWQAAFMAAGIPGFFVALLVLLIREPSRRANSQEAGAETYRLREIFAFLWRRRAFYGTVCGGNALIMVVLNSFPAWAPTYLIRHFHLPMSMVGLHTGLILLLCGSLGVLTGPVFGRWLDKRGYMDTALRGPALIATGLAIVGPLLPLAPTYPLALLVIGATNFLFSMPAAMSGAALQIASPNRMRGVVTALYVFVLTLVGLGVGPSLIALLTDYVFARAEYVGWSIAIVCTVAATISAITLWRGLPSYRRALETA